MGHEIRNGIPADQTAQAMLVETVMPMETVLPVEAVLPSDYQINLSDFALFLPVMKVREAYEDVLSIILEEPDFIRA